MKIIIYQIFTRLFANDVYVNHPDGSIEQNGCGKMKSINGKALSAIKDLGATHVWYTGIIAHATQTDYTVYGIPKDHPAVVKGRAGSPYAIKDYYDVDPDLSVDVNNRMREFELLVARTHRAGLKVVIDFVPNHVARQYRSLAKPDGVSDLGEYDDKTKAFSPGNNFYYIPDTTLGGELDLYDAVQGRYIEYPARATGNDRFDASPCRNDWYETVKLNYGTDYASGQTHFSPIPDTWYKMRDILLFWASKGVDAFRCDMAEMVPCEFWHWVIGEVKNKHPHIVFIAEVYNPHLYRHYIVHGGFDYLYDKVGLYDTLRGVISGYTSASAITQAWQAVDDIRGHMLYFLENHDEQRIASDFFAGCAERALPALVVSACLSGNPLMIYFGQELGERGMDEEGFSGRDGRTTIFDYWNPNTLFRWYNKGKFDEELLTEEERRLKNYYRKVLHLCRHERALSEGLFFDLMYANQGSWQMNDHRQYAFLRKYEDEVVFVAVNFAETSAHIRVNVPLHAFEYLGMAPCVACQATDLLTGEETILSFTDVHPAEMYIPAYGSRVWKFKC